MAQRISIHFNRANFGNADAELTEEMLTSATHSIVHSDDYDSVYAMLNRFMLARGVEVKYYPKSGKIGVSNGVSFLQFNTLSEAYQFVLECIVNTGGVQSMGEGE